MSKISDSTCVMIDCKGSACLMSLVFQTPDKPIFSNVSLSWCAFTCSQYITSVLQKDFAYYQSNNKTAISHYFNTSCDNLIIVEIK